ncbi:MAG: hypothetical protein FLDDKLPJ_00921 [Phycisphaerae bacterium]|nr:hypothetical protein [Phycisphaerae bacterium]
MLIYMLPIVVPMTIILLGLIFLPLQTLLMMVGGLTVVSGVVLLFFAPAYSVLAFLSGAVMLIAGIRMQRRQDDREAAQIESDARSYARRNELWVERDDR